ncbi:MULTISPECIES: hypothetical protein [Streptococcus]|uniref:Uncharacterized protein n=1 Tax=Streptococcus caledonicus TaxID=2614158 RepID=A0ABW0UBJ1_9STRE|nr:hypothetical protein [Streptococcus sp. S784/96/1]
MPVHQKKIIDLLTRIATLKELFNACGYNKKSEEMLLEEFQCPVGTSEKIKKASKSLQRWVI